MFKLNHTSFLG